ncbi:MAG TPA: cytochrome c oxidase accessory protein CcoG [Usitatibacter sp.]|nr:cytochrome c oxidase accessory protein CcoG [Usitatibacter sp.]
MKSSTERARRVVPIHAATPGTHPEAGRPAGDRERGAPPGSVTQVESLYEVRRKIYPRAVSGWFAGWRWALVILTQVIFYGLPWLQWHERQAVLFDLVARKFYIFGLVLWPQDFVYLTALLVVSAIALFLFTAIAGRLWCGYACPQTVYTELFLWIERLIEGDRMARMKLDAGPLGARKAALKSAKHAVWIVLSLWTGFTFVGYFTPIHDLVQATRTFDFGPWETFWIFFYGFATYGNAGFMREQVCKYMCPYARFQSVMFDNDTLVITYDRERGEPRGSRGRKVDAKAKGLGDCVDCNICVQVCPTGIDIREGLKYECIGCAACIDGCDQVMRKMGYPEGLIRYSTENAIRNHWGAKQILARVLRTRVLIYTALMAAVLVAAGVSLWLRVPLKMDVMRDRAAIARQIDDEHVENVYRLLIMNTDERAQRFTLSVEPSRHLAHLEIVPDTPEKFFTIDPVSSRTIAVRVQAVPHDTEGSQPIEFVLKTVGGEGREVTLHEKSRFIVPKIR